MAPMLTEHKFWTAGFSRVGTKHLDAGVPCEDAHFVGHDGDSFVLVACDGAGARTHSRHGADAVANAVGPLMLHNASEIMGRTLGGKAVLSVALDAINAAVGEHGGTADDYACTLVALLVHEGHRMTCHVGDGAIYVLNGVFPSILSPPDGEGRFTTFVTSPGAYPHMWKGPLEPHTTGFLVVTDGADCLANFVQGVVSPLVSRLIAQMDLRPEHRGAREFQAQCASTLGPNTNDDLTALVARRAHLFGEYGCPQCFAPNVERKRNAETGTYLVWCSKCSHIVYSVKDTQEKKRYELIYGLCLEPIRLS